MRNLIRKSVFFFLVFLTLGIFFSACTSMASGGQQILEVSGETYPIVKRSLFGRNHDFWIYQIRDITQSSKQKSTLTLGGNQLSETTRALGYTLIDNAGFRWNGIGVVDMEWGRREGETNKDKRVVSYRYRIRMDERNSGVTRFLDTYYDPTSPNFDGSLRGTITDELNSVVYTFESNPRLDTYVNPGKGLTVISIYKGNTAVCVIDRRNGYEVTFFEGFQATDRTQLASIISSFFILMRYGSL